MTSISHSQLRAFHAVATEGSFTKAAQAEGLQIVRNSKINKNASQSETLAEASQQQQAGAEAVYFGLSEGFNARARAGNFTLKELPAVQLPGRAREFRPDASGRWLLAHRAAGDSVWVIDLTTNRKTASILAEWSSDLPLVAGPSTLVVRQGDDVVALDLLTIPASETGRLPEGGRDRWLLVSWVPPERVPAALAAADSARLLQDSTLTADLTPRGIDSTRAYLQVSRTQNPEWASLLVKQLKADGFPASVLDPVEPEDGYRVVVGPYLNREAADSVGRAIGRAYFLIWLPEKRP